MMLERARLLSPPPPPQSAGPIPPTPPPPPACSHDLSPSLAGLTQLTLLDLSHNSLALGEWVSVFHRESG